MVTPLLLAVSWGPALTLGTHLQLPYTAAFPQVRAALVGHTLSTFAVLFSFTIYYWPMFTGSSVFAFPVLSLSGTLSEGRELCRAVRRLSFFWKSSGAHLKYQTTFRNICSLFLLFTSYTFLCHVAWNCVQQCISFCLVLWLFLGPSPSLNCDFLQGSVVSICICTFSMKLGVWKMVLNKCV